MTNEEIKAQLKKTLHTFKAPDEPFEIRLLHTPQKVVSGYYRNRPESVDKLLSDLQEMNLLDYTIYMTLNPPQSACLARCDNRLQASPSTTTKDAEIDRIHWLHVDLDPKRPAGIQATQEEVTFAEVKMIEIQRYFAENGIVDPVLSFSGNGYNLDYRFDLENSKENVKLFKDTLKFLSNKFSDEHLDVDTTTYNPSRIIKLYGCISRKGENTEDRPHRYSAVQSIPDTVTVNDIARLSALVNVPQTPSGKKSKHKEEFSVEGWLEKYGFGYKTKEGEDGSELFLFDVCPWNNEHTNGSAFLVRFPDGNLMAKCHHNSCSEQNLDTLFKLFPPDVMPSPSQKPKNEKSAADSLLALAIKHMEFFKDSNNNSYVLYKAHGTKLIANTESEDIALYLRRLYYDTCQKTVGKDVLRQVADTLNMFGKTSNDVRNVHSRVAYENGALYYDLNNTAYDIIKIDSAGCELADSRDRVYFMRDNNMKAQLSPDLSAKPSELLDYIQHHFRIKDAQEAVLFAVYLVSCFLEQISHPILIIHGEKGSAKSTTMRMIQQIVAPSVNELLSIPQRKDDLVVILSKNYYVAFDNLQILNQEKSDILCIASTGGTYVKRKLYTNGENVSLNLKSCVACNGINVVASQSDLLDRAILIELERIPEKERQTDNYIWNEFQKDLPMILGCCFNALSETLGIINRLNFKSLPRMADFMRWGCAIAIGLGLDYKLFYSAYINNIKKTKKESIDSNALAECLIQFMKKHAPIWTGTWTDLYTQIKDIAISQSISAYDNSIPKAPAALSKKLNEIKSDLETEGIYFEKAYDHDNKIVTIKKILANGDGAKMQE